ncbi:MAG: tRNA (guanosine(37)-N1)-methyltransferase TrmD [Clostridia bacterium]|nr:tRNA (guanosine(37)-N1)-methyltransferase TrmD [Clostridia bacterium]
MKISFVTLFPEMFEPLKASLIGKAQEKNALKIEIINIRDFSQDKHKKCDDYPFGGGAGMLMTPQPIYDAITSIRGYKKAHKIYMSPKGKTLNQAKVKELSKFDHLIILCGHYEGIDERIIDLLIDEEISIGDFVLTGGEIPAMALADSVARFIPGVLGSLDSTVDESFSDNLLEYPQYTRPQEFKGLSVPEVLVSGDHAKVDEWRKQEALKITKARRPDLLR